MTVFDNVAAALAAAGTAPTPAAVADVLWLATHIPAPEPIGPAHPAGGQPPAGPPGQPPGGPAALSLVRAVEAASGTPPAAQPATERAAERAGPPGRRLWLVEPAREPAPPRPPVDAGEWQAVLANALSGRPDEPSQINQLGTGRALRPLRLRRADPERLELDEEATAERSAGGRWKPVLRPEVVRWPDLAIVLDESPAAAMFQPVVRALQQVCGRLGAFREIRGWHLRPAGSAHAHRTALAVRSGLPGAELSGGAGLAGGTGLPGGVAPSGAAGRSGPVVVGLTGPGQVELPAAQLADPTGRRLILVLTDGSSPAWTGAYRELVEAWAKVGPVAIISLVPARAWPRHGLRTVAGEVRAPRPLAPNRSWLTRPVPGGSPLPRQLTVPVTELAPSRLARAADVLGGCQRWVAVQLLAGPEASRPPGRRPVEPATAVAGFRSRVQPAAASLLHYLAAAPLLLPFAEHVRRTMVPDSGVEDTAAILFATGLVEQVGQTAGTFRFRDGVRAALRLDLSPPIRTAVERELLAFGCADSGLKLPADIVEQLISRPDDAGWLLTALDALPRPPGAGWPGRPADESAASQPAADPADGLRVLAAVRDPEIGPFAITALAAPRAAAAAAAAALGYRRRGRLSAGCVVAVSAGQVIAAVADGTDAARGGPWREWLDRARGGLLLVQAAHLLADRGSWPARTALAGIATILRTEHDPGVVFAAERGRLDLLRDHPAMARLLAADRVVSLAPTLADAAFRLVLGYLRGDLVDWVPAAETAIWSVLRAQYQAEGEYFQAEEAARSLFGRTIDEWQPGGGPVEPAHVPSYRAADPGKASST